MKDKGPFPLLEAKEQIVASTGNRGSVKRKMMWEGEYIEWACGSKGGFLSKTEANANWKNGKTMKALFVTMMAPEDICNWTSRRAHIVRATTTSISTKWSSTHHR